MKKFEPEKELQKIKSNRKQAVNSKISNMFVPILVMACSLMGLVGVTFSANLISESSDTFVIKVDVINGSVATYTKTVSAGAFSDVIFSDNSYGSIECTSGNLTYDSITSTISSPYINQNTSCVLVFVDDDSTANIDLSELNSVTDYSGLSYYYKGNATNNYVKLKDKLYRIVRINGDGTIRLMLNEVILSSNYGSSNVYTNSNIKTVLDNWFNNNFDNESYLVQAVFDTNNYEDFDGNVDTLINDYSFYLSYVGTLSIKEVQLIGTDSNSYLNTSIGIYLLNGSGLNDVYVYKNNQIQIASLTDVLNVRPVINVSGTLVGEGTIDNPYTLNEA